MKYLFFLLLISCVENPKTDNTNNSKSYIIDSVVIDQSLKTSKIDFENLERRVTKFGHSINTLSNEAFPVLSKNERFLYFTGLDRSGFFDFKLNFINQKNAGGEDLFYSERSKSDSWNDARPLKFLNTNAHESISQVRGDTFLLSANYKENIGFIDKDGINTSDLFLAVKQKDSFKIIHFEEPINSLFTESDAFLFKNAILFVSDRPGRVGDYHKKGWNWNGSMWGNTDIWISFLTDQYNWSVPKNLGDIINTAGAERTPFLSKDGLNLYLSSNGYEADKTDLDIYKFTRDNIDDWFNWKGPIRIQDVNTDSDEFGYILDSNDNAYFTRGVKLDFERTNSYQTGGNGIYETNFRTNYKVFGAQIGSYNNDFQTDIYKATNSSYDYIISDFFFDTNKHEILKNEIHLLDDLVDFLNINNPGVIIINGYTDNVGSESYNIKLSLLRAQSVRDYLLSKGIKNNILYNGFGEKNPLTDNSNSEKRKQNRRVEIVLSE